MCCFSRVKRSWRPLRAAPDEGVAPREVGPEEEEEAGPEEGDEGGPEEEG